jgi:hypothetical protein
MTYKRVLSVWAAFPSGTSGLHVPQIRLEPPIVVDGIHNTLGKVCQVATRANGLQMNSEVEYFNREARFSQRQPAGNSQNGGQPSRVCGG